MNKKNTAIRTSERAKLQEFYDELVDPTFQLYLYFLQGRLPLLASINTQLQKSDQDLFTVYQKISSFKCAFLEPVLHNVGMGMKEDNIRSDIDEIDYQCCSQFQQFKEQSVSSGLLSPRQLHVVMKNVFSFTSAIGQSLETRFPEMEFVVQNLSFLCPENRKHCRCNIEAVVSKYCQGMVDATVAKMQYSVYRNDDSLKFLYLNCGKKPDAFFCKIAAMPEYNQFGLLATILLCMSPDTVECERGFSSVNFTKDKFSTRLSQENLNARLSIVLDSRTLDSFPWQSISSDF